MPSSGATGRSGPRRVPPPPSPARGQPDRGKPARCPLLLIRLVPPRPPHSARCPRLCARLTAAGAAVRRLTTEGPRRGAQRRAAARGAAGRSRLCATTDEGHATCSEVEGARHHNAASRLRTLARGCAGPSAAVFLPQSLSAWRPPRQAASPRRGRAAACPRRRLARQCCCRCSRDSRQAWAAHWQSCAGPAARPSRRCSGSRQVRASAPAPGSSLSLLYLQPAPRSEPSRFHPPLVRCAMHVTWLGRHSRRDGILSAQPRVRRYQAPKAARAACQQKQIPHVYHTSTHLFPSRCPC